MLRQMAPYQTCVLQVLFLGSALLTDSVYDVFCELGFFLVYYDLTSFLFLILVSSLDNFCTVRS